MVIKSVAVAASVYGIVVTTPNALSLLYFTNLSNIAADIMLIIFLIADICLLVSHGMINCRTAALYSAKFMFTISAALTFFVSLFGVRWGGMTAPYNFLNYGAKTGWFGFDLSAAGPETLGIGVAYSIAGLSLIFIGFGFALLGSKKLRQRTKATVCQSRSRYL